MAGKRMIHSNICESKKLAEISLAAETLYYRLLTRVDDDGNFTADPRIVLGTCAPLRREWNEKIVSELLEELSLVTVGDKKPLISFYNKDGDKFLHITKFEEFQYLRPDRTPTVKFPTHPARLGTSLVNQRLTNGGAVSTPIQDKIKEVKIKDNINYKNIRTRWGRCFKGILLNKKSPKMQEAYTASCLKYGEQVVLDKLDEWALQNPWVVDHKNGGNMLCSFLDDLDVMIEVGAELTADRVSEAESEAKHEASMALSQEQGRKAAEEARDKILADIAAEEKLAEKLTEVPF